MGVDTKVLLTTAPSPLDVLAYVAKNYRNANISPFGGNSNAYWLNFLDGEDNRSMSLFPAGECASDYADIHSGPATYLSLGCWGNSEIIARRMAIHFGGFIMPNDSTDDWMRP